MPRAPRARAADVRRTLGTGRSVAGERVVLYVSPGRGTVAVVAGRRIGGAVARNRARRILREAWRACAPPSAGEVDVVLVARPAIGGASSRDLVSEMEDLIRRAGIDRP